MALLGVLAIMQIVFLPGYLLTRVLRLRGGTLTTLVLAFALSLVANHVLIVGLVVLGIYRPALIYAIFATETVSLLWIQRRSLQTSAIDAGWFRFSDFLGTLPRSPLKRMFLAAATVVIAGFALAGMAQFGQIFQQWDAVVSWNRWATDWAANRLPDNTSLYPQLLPTNVSLTYVFMQTSDVWIFAKAFQFLFCLMLLLAMLDAARVTGNFGFVPGLLITYWLLVAVLRFRMIGSGYADMPLAFFSFATVYTLLLAKRAGTIAMRPRYVMVGAVLAAGAALAKQTGLYIATVYPLLAWLLVLRSGNTTTVLITLRRDGSSSRRSVMSTVGSLLRVALLIGILVAPWYLYKFAEFHAVRDSNNTAQLVHDSHEGRSLPQRMLHGASMVVETTTPAGAMLLLLAIGGGLRDPPQRWLVGLVVVPVGLIWAAGFSYDLRNLALILPFAGTAAGMGLWRAVEWLDNRLPRSDAAGPVSAGCTERSSGRVVRVGYVAGLLALAVVVACLGVSDKALRECQERQQRLVGIPELNRPLYDYFESHRGLAPIATDYQALAWLPELGPWSVRCACDTLSAFRATYDRPDVRFALVRRQEAATAVQEYLDGSAGRFVFETRSFRFYEKSDPSMAARKILAEKLAAGEESTSRRQSLPIK